MLRLIRPTVAIIRPLITRYTLYYYIQYTACGLEFLFAPSQPRLGYKKYPRARILALGDRSLIDTFSFLAQNAILQTPSSPSPCHPHPVTLTLLLDAMPKGPPPNSLESFDRLLSMSAYALAHSAARSCANPCTVLPSSEFRFEPDLDAAAADAAAVAPAFSLYCTDVAPGQNGSATAAADAAIPEAEGEEEAKMPLFLFCLGFCGGLHSEEDIPFDEHALDRSSKAGSGYLTA